MFGNTYSLLTKTLPRFGVKTHLCDLTNLDEVRRAVDADTCCIFLEIITNPQLEVADLTALAEIAHAHNIPLVADTTAIPFTEFCAHELGVDIEVVSTTKYLSGAQHRSAEWSSTTVASLSSHVVCTTRCSSTSVLI